MIDEVEWEFGADELFEAGAGRGLCIRNVEVEVGDGCGEAHDDEEIMGG